MTNYNSGDSNYSELMKYLSFDLNLGKYDWTL